MNENLLQFTVVGLRNNSHHCSPRASMGAERVRVPAYTVLTWTAGSDKNEGGGKLIKHQMCG